MAQQEHKGVLRQILDRLYSISAMLAAVCLVAMLVVIVLQMVVRWSSMTFPGSSEIAGYLMAAASFFAFAGALNSGAHIRVAIGLNALGKYRFWGEVWCLIIGSAATAYLGWYAVRLVYWSHKLGDVSQGQDAAPLWIVQMPVAIGSILLAVVFADNLITLIFTGRDNIRDDRHAQSHTE